MKRTLFAAVAAMLLMAGCAQTDAGRSAAPAPQAATKSAPAAAPAAATSDKNLPSPLLTQPGGNKVITGGSIEVCQQQCERSYQICMDGSATRPDTLSGTMYEGRMFGPAARCETSLASCMKRCTSAVKK
jgi:hypothetical protein